jgi:hypothetical protein
VIAALGQLRTLLQIFPQGLEGGKVKFSALSILFLNFLAVKD